MLRLIAILTISSGLIYFALQQTPDETIRNNARPLPGYEKYRGQSLEEYLRQRGMLKDMSEDTITSGRMTNE